jgi:hypothetical protein
MIVFELAIGYTGIYWARLIHILLVIGKYHGFPFLLSLLDVIFSELNGLCLRGVDDFCVFPERDVDEDGGKLLERREHTWPFSTYA